MPEDSAVTAEGPVRARPSAKDWWKPVLVGLLAASTLLCGFSLLIPALTGSAYTDYDGVLRRYFDVGLEGNFPTWWNSSLLAVAAVGAGAVGAIHRSERSKDSIAWFVLALIPVRFSIDDATILHEHLEKIVALIAVPVAFPHPWVVLGIPIALGVLLTVIICTRRLHKVPATLLLTGFTLYFVGALGLEISAGLIAPAIGEGFIFNLIYHLEELLEMSGAALMLVAPLSAVPTPEVRPLPLPDT